MSFFEKHRSSRILATQVCTWPGTGSVVTSAFGSQTYQIRVTTQVAGWIGIDNSATVISTSTFAGGAFIGGGVTGEVFTTTPGQTLEFTSTTTTSGWLVSIAEMG